MLKLQLQYFGYLVGITESLKKKQKTKNNKKKPLTLGKVEGRRRRGQQGIRWLYGITDSTDMSLSKLRESVKGRKPGVLQSTGPQRVGQN